MDNTLKEKLISEKRKELEKIYTLIRDAETPEDKMYYGKMADESYEDLKALKKP